MLKDWQPGADLELPNADDLELLVLDGTFSEGSERMDRLTWLRLPAGHRLQAHVGPDGACVWYKCAPLLHEQVCAFDDNPSLERGKE